MTESADPVPECSVNRLTADLHALSEFRDEERPGWTRRAFSPQYVAARDWLAARMADAGLSVRRDPVSNLIGVLPGTAAGPALATGSHTDTVEGGGRFDGVVGVLAALEAVRTLRDAGIRLRHELRVIDFFNEEPNQYGVSCVGSRALGGTLTAEHLRLDDGAGETLAEGMARVGCDPANALRVSLRPGELAAFLELHIEQGSALEREGLPLAIVTAIAGIDRYRFGFEGRPDHAGATSMGVRRDALCAAAEAVLAVEQLAADGGGVGTTGRLEVTPNAANVVPGAVNAWAELRSGDRAWLDQNGRQLRAVTEYAAKRRGVRSTYERVSTVDPVPADGRVRELIGVGVDRLRLPYKEMFSGAGHDAAHLTGVAPVGMLFVPSVDGRSHCPEEWTDLDQVAVGARALAQALVEVDRAADAGR